MFFTFFDYLPYQAGDEDLLEIEDQTFTELMTKIYPNPINSDVNFGFSVAQGDNIKMGIYDLQGNLVKVIEKNKFYPKGRHIVH